MAYNNAVLSTLITALNNDDILYVRDNCYRLVLIKKQLPDGRYCWTRPTRHERKQYSKKLREENKDGL